MGIRVAVFAVASMLLASCHASGSPQSTSTFAATGDSRCVITYHSSGSETAATVRTKIAGSFTLHMVGIDQTTYPKVMRADAGEFQVKAPIHEIESMVGSLKIATGKIRCAVEPA